MRKVKDLQIPWSAGFQTQLLNTIGIRGAGLNTRPLLHLEIVYPSRVLTHTSQFLRICDNVAQEAI